MMLPEIRQLAQSLPVDASPQRYESAICQDNILHKPTTSSRAKSYRHLVQLYALQRQSTLFRALREFFSADGDAVPLIALVCVFCRDEQLRASFGLVSQLRVGEGLPRTLMESYLEDSFPGRFSDAMKKSLAQNVNTTWTESGHLVGRARKVRARPQPRVLASVYAMLAGFLLGLRGEVLLNSVFADLVGADVATLAAHLASAAARPYLRFRHAGGVTEVDFSPYLNEQELEIAHGTD